MIMHQSTSDQDDLWETPQEFEECKLLEWPKEAFPEFAQRYIEEVSRSTETPIELAAMLFLSAIATVSQKTYEVEVNQSHKEPVCIWVLPILPPASRKSSVFGQITAPIRIWEDEKKSALEIDINRQISKQKTLEEKVKFLRKRAAKAEREEFEHYQTQINVLEKEIDLIPAYPRLWASDITPEHLGTLMAQNNESISILSDEGAIFDIVGGLYSNGKSNIDLLLQAHSGGSVRVDRKSKNPILMKKALLTIGITVQPEVVKNIFKNKTFRGRGLLGRFLYVFPPSNIGKRTLEEKPMDEYIRSHYHASIISIVNHPRDPKNNSQHVLKLEEKAYLKWLDYAKNVETLMSPEFDYLSHITDWAGKLCGQIIRIAGLLHIYRYAFEKPWEREISLQDVQGAIKIGHVLIQHALKVFNQTYENEEARIAKEILRWINNRFCESFVRRDCLKKFARYHRKATLQSLEMLEDRGYIRSYTYQPPKGAPSPGYMVNHKYQKLHAEKRGQKGQKS